MTKQLTSSQRTERSVILYTFDGLQNFSGYSPPHAPLFGHPRSSQTNFCQPPHKIQFLEAVLVHARDDHRNIAAVVGETRGETRGPSPIPTCFTDIFLEMFSSQEQPLHDLDQTHQFICSQYCTDVTETSVASTAIPLMLRKHLSPKLLIGFKRAPDLPYITPT